MGRESPWKLMGRSSESQRAGQVGTLCPSLGSSAEGGAKAQERKERGEGRVQPSTMREKRKTGPVGLQPPRLT